AELAQQNASMENYAAAFGKGNVDIGPAITKFAESMIVGAGVTRRIAIFNAFNNYHELSTIDPNLSYLVEFLGALSFGAEILAEEGTVSGPNGNPVLTQADLNTFQLTGTPTAALGNLTLSDISASPGNYDLLNCALLEVAAAVGNLHSTGSFST